MSIRSLDQLPVAGKKVFCRVDFNVPLNENGEVTDDTRIRAALPTIRHILNEGGQPICASHLGRPKGQVVDHLRMEPVGVRLAELLGGDHRVLAADESVGDGVRKVVEDAREGDVVLLENLRFNPGETKNDEQFAKGLAALADVYVNDAFGTAHRAHASTAGIVSQLTAPEPNRAAGLLMNKEVEMLGRMQSNAETPFAAILGGAKVSDKIGVIESLMQRVTALLIGGAMANTFLAAAGKNVGRSKIEEDKLALAKGIIEKAAERGVDLLVPIDVIVAEGLDSATGNDVSVDDIPADLMALDIGPQTCRAFADKLAAAKTVFWNGPMGVFEQTPFAEGTFSVARAISAASCFSVVGGGDSVAAIHQSGLADQISHISTGGGASLEFIEGRVLPGLAALEI